MYHAEMDTSDLGGIIVDESHRAFAESTPKAKPLYAAWASGCSAA